MKFSDRELKIMIEALKLSRETCIKTKDYKNADKNTQIINEMEKELNKRLKK